MSLGIDDNTNFEDKNEICSKYKAQSIHLLYTLYKFN